MVRNEDRISCIVYKLKNKQAKTDEEFDMFTQKLLSWRYIIYLMKYAFGKSGVQYSPTFKGNPYRKFPEGNSVLG